MNIWLLPSAFHPSKGGVEEATLQLARHLVVARHRVTVVTNRHPSALPANDEVEGVPTVRILFDAPRMAIRPALSFPISFVRTLSLMLQIRPKPDLLHVQCVSTQAAAAVAVATALRVPLVVTTQGEVEMDSEQIFRESAYMRLLLSGSSRVAARLTACSSWAAKSAALLAPRFAEAVIVPNGIDPDQWSVTARPSEPVVVAWGRHVREKGFDLLFDAWPLVVRRIPGARLLVGGTGPETASLRSRAPDGASFVGALDRADVSGLIERGRVAVVPSRLEPFGIVGLEATASGRPVVWSTRGGMAEAMGECGWPVDPLDTNALADSIVGALRSNVDSSSLRAHAVRFSWRDITERYLRVYESVSAG